MNRREALAATLATLPTLAVGQGSKSSKKGWAGANAKYHQQFGATWFYNWAPKARPSNGVEFVPMIKGEWGVTQIPAIRKTNGITHLLGYNEPERAKQGNLSIDRALKLWPQLEELAKAKNLRLGSPAPSSDDGGMQWFHTFMKRAKERRFKIDFIAMHWYRGRDAEAFEKFVEDLVKKYRIPIWITEFNGWSGPEPEHYRFLQQALRFLEKSRDVERYAYFNPKSGQPHALLSGDGTPTRLGKLYRDTGG